MWDETAAMVEFSVLEDDRQDRWAMTDLRALADFIESLPAIFREGDDIRLCGVSLKQYVPALRQAADEFEEKGKKKDGE